MAVEYGTIAVVPKGTWDGSIQYEVANLVTHDGSSYLAHTQPPMGTPPTDPAYWQISAAGTGKATADSPGTVKPDNKTLTIDSEGTLSAVKATQSSLGMIKGSNDINVAEDGALSINTDFTQATELSSLITGEAVKEVLGKISKAIAVTMSLDQNALLKNVLTNIDLNDREKIPTAALVHTLIDRIGMGEDLSVGNNLTEAVGKLSQNFNKLNSQTWDISRQARTVAAGTSQDAETWVCPETGLYLVNIVQYVNMVQTAGRLQIKFIDSATRHIFFMACASGLANAGGAVFNSSRVVELNKGTTYGFILVNETSEAWNVNNDPLASYWNITGLKQY